VIAAASAPAAERTLGVAARALPGAPWTAPAAAVPATAASTTIIHPTRCTNFMLSSVCSRIFNFTNAAHSTSATSSSSQWRGRRRRLL
jgi:hypothetical protein